ncbi:MAG TPA: HIT family protein [Candidatus Nanoarchaeia archaeon]|nr:HIT family protein [Candidatus Nanoarchaeia archaeon]
MNDCLFCKIVKGEIPAENVYEDKNVVAFLDIHPRSIGHTLIVPKKHYDLLTDMPEKELAAFAASLQNVARGFQKYAEGINILQNNGKAAGQLVSHVHFHLIPRRNGDGIRLLQGEILKNVDLNKVQKDIQRIFK